MTQERFEKEMQRQKRAEKRWLRLGWVMAAIVAAPLLVGCGIAAWILAVAYL